MAGFTKLFSDIVRSTIWREPDHVRIVWITMLAIADKHGVVESSFPGLADLAKVGLEQCGAALEVLKSPDEWSRTKVDEGRRIREVDGGWLIINYEKYRNRLSADDRREYQRVKQVEYRAKRKRGGATAEGAAARAYDRGDVAGGDAIMEEENEQRMERKRRKSGSGAGTIKGANQPEVEGGAEGALSGVAHPGTGEDGSKGDNQEGSGVGGVQAQEGQTELAMKLAELARMAKNRGPFPEV